MQVPFHAIGIVLGRALMYLRPVSKPDASTTTPAEAPVRLSTESRTDLDGWMRAFERINCRVDYMNEDLRSLRNRQPPSTSERFGEGDGRCNREFRNRPARTGPRWRTVPPD